MIYDIPSGVDGVFLNMDRAPVTS